MASLNAIRAAIKATIEAAIPDVQVYPADQALTHYPCVVIDLVNADYALTMGKGNDSYVFHLRTYVAEISNYSYEVLDGLVTGYSADGKNIRSAIFGTPGLGLSNTTSVVRELLAYGTTAITPQSRASVMAILKLEVTTSGTS